MDAPLNLMQTPHLTRQRRLVLDILKETRGHLDAGFIFQEAMKRNNRISLATVYRSLEYLKKAGLVEENNFGEDHGHFEMIQDTRHFHFSCINCGKVIELKGAGVQEAFQSARELRGYQVTEMQIHLRGTCPDCRKERRQPGGREKR